jgi:hypothetical protein
VVLSSPSWQVPGYYPDWVTVTFFHILGVGRATAGVRIPAEARDFSLLHSGQTGSGAHQPVQLVQGAFSQEINRPEREADHSPPSRAEVKNGGATPTLPIHLQGTVLN